MLITFTYNASVNSAPAAFKIALNAAAQFLDNFITNAVTINFQIGWGENNGTPLGTTIANGGVAGGKGYSYTALINALTSHATSADDFTALQNLPSVDPTHG